MDVFELFFDLLSLFLDFVEVFEFFEHVSKIKFYCGGFCKLY